MAVPGVLGIGSRFPRGIAIAGVVRACPAAVGFLLGAVLLGRGVAGAVPGTDAGDSPGRLGEPVVGPLGDLLVHLPSVDRTLQRGEQPAETAPHSRRGPPERLCGVGGSPSRGTGRCDLVSGVRIGLFGRLGP